MRVLVYGGNGFLGSYFVNLLTERKHVVKVSSSRVDNPDAVTKDIMDFKPTHVFSCTGRTHGGGINTIDYLEQPGKLGENLKDNLFGPMVLATLCHTYGVHCTIMGTGCIFTSPYENGKPMEKYKEGDEPNFFGSSYSVVKGFTDRLLHLPMLNETLNLRIRMPIMNFRHPRCFITKIAGYAKICSIANSMTYVPELFPLVVDMMEKKRRGTINLVNPGVITHNEILKMYEAMVDPLHKTENFSEEEQNKILAAGRSNNQLDTTLLEEWYPRVQNIHKAVKCALEKYN